MSSPDLSEAAVAMNRQRWGTPSPVLSRAVQTVSDRRAELDESLRAQVLEIAGQLARDGDDAR